MGEFKGEALMPAELLLSVPTELVLTWPVPEWLMPVLEMMGTRMSLPFLVTKSLLGEGGGSLPPLASSLSKVWTGASVP